MNILHLNDQDGWRGGEQQAAYLISGTPRHGHRTFVAGRQASPILTADFSGAESGRYALPFRGELDLLTAWRIARLARTLDIDVLHAHTSHTHTNALLARRFNPRVRVVVSRRVDFPPRNGFLNRWKYTSPDATIAISNCIAGILREYGLPEEKLWTVHSGIDVSRLDVAPIAREKLGVPADAPLLCNVAALVGHKDHQTLLGAMAQLLETQPRAQLVIVGEGPLRAALERRTSDLGIESSVHFLGYRSDVPSILRAADLFVFSSKEEGLGTSVLDAMAARVPVVATRAGGIPEMVRNGETGILVEPQNPAQLAAAVSRALQSPQILPPLVTAAADLVQREFSVEAMVEGNVRVYEALLAVRDEVPEATKR